MALQPGLAEYSNQYLPEGHLDATRLLAESIKKRTMPLLEFGPFGPFQAGHSRTDSCRVVNRCEGRRRGDSELRGSSGHSVESDDEERKVWKERSKLDLRVAEWWGKGGGLQPLK